MTAFVLGCLLPACATTDDAATSAQPQAEKADKVYRTGSNIPSRRAGADAQTIDPGTWDAERGRIGQTGPKGPGSN